MKAYKGFKVDETGALDCRGFKFAEGETYEHDGPVKACQSGFHACEMPLHVLRYYPPATSVFHVVELGGEIDKDGDDSKVAAKKLTVGAKVGLPGLIQAQVEYVTSRAKPMKGSTTRAANGAATASGYYGAATASGDSGAATASGDSGAATASGYSGAATASGYSGAATASGDSGAATASGYYGAATASGYYGAATASGDSGAATASGHSGAATASGYYGAATASGHSGAATASGDSGAATASGHSGAATASGDSGAAKVEGPHSVAAATGHNGKAAGAIGCVLLLVERNPADWSIVGHQSVMVDGENIKADTWYALRGGKVVTA